MLLADQITENTNPAFPSFAAEVAKAQHFRLSAAVTMAVGQVAEQGGDALEKMMPLLRMPFKNMWLEFRNADRPARPPDVNQWVPDRIGFLIVCHADSVQRGVIHMAWSFPGIAGVEICPLCIAFDWSEDPVAPFHGDDLTHRFQQLPSPLGMPFWKMFETIRREQPKQAEEFARGWNLDWYGELNFAFGVIAMLNTRRGVRYVEVDQSKVNKHRRAKGKAELISHRIVELDLSRVQLRRMGLVPGVSAEKIRQMLTLVRGHFKVRKTGIFWWHPHARGNAAIGKIEHEYEVKQ